MSVAKRNLAVLVFGLWLIGAIASSGQEPAVPPTLLPRELATLGTASVSSAGPSNQQLADAVARSLRESDRLHRYRIDIQVGDGEVELQGKVADFPQKEEALRLAKAVPGVLRIRDRLQVGNTGAIIAVQALPMGEQGPAPQRMDGGGPPVGGPSNLPPMNPSYPQEPMPINQVPAYDPLLQAPPMPPYAWPTYAPYNNYSRVAYPSLYPYEAFPFIGPFHPFPKVPTGWRSVSLTWNDGFWWYGKNATGHDWWRIKYR